MVEGALGAGEDGKGDPIVDAGDRREFFNADFEGVFNLEEQFPKVGVD